MNNTILLDYKFSLFGDFNVLYRNVSQLTQIPFYKKHIIERTDAAPNGSSIPIYLFESDISFLRIGNARIDVCFKADNDGVDSAFNQTIDTIKTLLPTYFLRVAINYTFNVIDGDSSQTKLVSKRFNIFSDNNGPNDFSVSQVFKSHINSIASNNIINIQTANMIDKTTFMTKRVLACTFDINTVPIIDGNERNYLTKDNLPSLFKDAKTILSNNIVNINKLFDK